MYPENPTNYYPRYGHHRRDVPYVRSSWFIPYPNLARTHFRSNRAAYSSLLPNVPPPYPVHENLWNMQQNSQEVHRRLMNPLNLSTNHSRGSCSCDRRHCAGMVRRRPPIHVSISVQ